MTRSRRIAFVFGIVAASSALAQERGTVPSRPAVAPEKHFVFPKITFETLPNGLKLAVMENHEVPLVSVKVGTYSSASIDPVGKHGAWNLMMNALRTGTTSRSAAQIADTLEALGTSVTWQPGSSLNGLPQYTTAKAVWRPVLDIVADMLMNASFPQDAVRRLQAQAATAAKPFAAQASVQTMSRAVFGDGHPMASFPVESEIRTVTRDDLVALRDQYLRPQNAYLVIAGDVTPATARAAALNSFGSWQSTGDTIRAVDVPPVVAAKPTAIYLVDYPAAALTAIGGAEPLPPADSPDADALEVVDAIVGSAQSSLGSRMYDMFRAKHGLSYAPNSFLTWRTGAVRGIWQLTASVAPEKADSAIVFMNQIVRDLHGDRPITQEELDFAKSSLIKRRPASMEMVTQQATAIYQMLYTRRSPDYLKSYADRIAGVTLDRARSVAAKYLDPEHLVLVAVGDRSKMEAALRATGIPVVIVDH